MEMLVHNLVENLPATAETNRGVQAGHRRRPSDAVFETIHQHGRHKHKSAVPPDIQSYWGICDELHEADRLLLFVDQLIVPTLL